MKIKTKWTFYKWLPFQYRTFEKYLQKQALKGWHLEKMVGCFLKFKRGQAKRVEYSIDIMDSIKYYHGQNSEELLEYREYCRVAGWNFVCGSEKIQVYCSDMEKPKVEIHTDEKQKFKSIYKATLKTQCIFWINCIIFSNIMINNIKNVSLSLLADKQILVFNILIATWIFTESVNFISYVIFLLKGFICLNKNCKINYDSKLFLINKAINNFYYFNSIIAIIAFGGKYVGFIVVFLFLIGYLLEKIKNKNLKRRKLTVTIFLVVFTIVFIQINILSIGISIFNQEKQDSKNKVQLTLNDFNAECENDAYVKITENLFASNVMYSNKEGDMDLYYDLFESKYKFINKFIINRLLINQNQTQNKYLEKDFDISKDVKVYVTQKGDRYLIFSEYKILELKFIEGIEPQKLIETCYEKSF